MGTKTGTAEKVSTEVCLHAEMAYQQARARGGPQRTRAELRAQKPHKGSCYTSSMCAWGHLPDSGREVMVLVVVDEPRGARHFGSEIAGPAAVSILKEALGVTHGSVPASEAPAAGFAPLEDGNSPGKAGRNGFELMRRALPEQPWREDAHAPR